MRALVLALAVAACVPASEAPVSKSLTLRAAGLYLQPNDLGEVPDGALSQADNVVISRDSVVEPRRGQVTVSAKALARIAAWRGALVGWGTSGVLSQSPDTGVTWADFAGAYPAPPGAPVRFSEASGNLYFTSALGLQRLDALAGMPAPAGVPPALDVQPSVAGAGTAVSNNVQVGYRAVFGKRDANSNVLLGAPSQRTVLVNTAGSAQDVVVSATIPPGVDSSFFWQVHRTAESVDQNTDPGDEMGLVYESPVPAAAAVTQLARTANVVTATTAAPHGFAANQIVQVSPGGVTLPLSAVVGYATATSPDGIAWTSRTMPAGTYNGVAWNGSVYAAVGNSGAAATSPDGTTWTARTIPAGTYYAVAWNGSVFVAVGNNVCATSPDGITWTARTIPSTFYSAIAWNGSLFVAVGGACATSPDGVTWTARTLFGGAYLGVVWNGSLFVTVGGSLAATSPDGITWTARTIPAGTYYAVAWSGSVFAAVGNSIAATSPDGTTWTSRAIPAGSYFGSTWAGGLFVAVGAPSLCATSPDGIAWTSRTIPAAQYNAIASGGGSSATFTAGAKTITGVTSTTFTYAETGANGTLVQAETAAPLTAVVTDSVPSGFRGASLYTSPTQQGIAGSYYQPPLAVDIATYRGSMFFAQPTDRAVLELGMLSAQSPVGVQSGDTVTVNGIVFSAGAAESIPTRTFAVAGVGTASQRIQATTASLVRVVNRAQGSPVTALDVSDPLGTPGHVRFIARALADSVTVSFSRPSSWSATGGLTAAPKTTVHELRWSPQLQPDAVPLVNYARIGSANKAILRIVATRDSLFVFKEDGLWRLSGDAPPWTIAPFDPTCILKAPESAVMLDNAVFALTNQGVVRVTDTGVTVISRPIETALQPLLGAAMLSTTASVAFGVAYESYRKFYLWLPVAPGATAAANAYVFDLFTQTWVRDTRGPTHGVVNAADDKLYLAIPSSGIARERKDYADSDYADDAGAISTVTQWSPKFGDTPGSKAQFSVVNAIFRKLGGTSITLAFSTDLVPTQTGIVYTLSDYGSPPFAPFTLRTWVPLEASRGSQLNVTLSAAMLSATFQLQGLGIEYRGTREEAGY